MRAGSYAGYRPIRSSILRFRCGRDSAARKLGRPGAWVPPRGGSAPAPDRDPIHPRGGSAASAKRRACRRARRHAGAPPRSRSRNSLAKICKPWAGPGARSIGRPAGSRRRGLPDSSPSFSVVQSAPPFCPGPAQVPQGRAQVFAQCRERPLCGRAAAYHHVVRPRPAASRQNLSHHRPQTAPCPVSPDRVADLAADREADANLARGGARGLVVRAPAGLKDQARGRPFGARPRDLQEFSPFPQAPDIAGSSGGWPIPVRPFAGHRPGLRGEALATLGATARNDVAAANGRHAGTEPMTALTDQHTRLIRALHGYAPISGSLDFGSLYTGRRPLCQRRGRDPTAVPSHQGYWPRLSCDTNDIGDAIAAARAGRTDRQGP